MALEGDVKTLPVRDLLGWLARTDATGVLELSRRMTSRTFHLRRGRVVMAASSEQEMLLGHLLIERGLVPRERLEALLAAHGRSRTRLGRLVLREELVPPGALRDALAERARRLLADALCWVDGQFLFEPGKPPRTGGVAFAVDLTALLAGTDDAIAVTDADVIDVSELV